MPYYPEDQSVENLNKIRRNNVCAVCGRQLYIYLDMETKQRYLACPTPEHEGIAREYKPQSTDYQSNIRRETELEREHGPGTTVALRGLPKHGQLTQPQAEHILSLVYPGCPRDEIIRCAILCRDFGLHPLMKEVYLIPFKEKGGGENYVTVLGINATRKLMSQRGTYSYFDDTPRLMTIDEQKRIFGEVDAGNIVAITKLRTKDGLEAPGYGRWPKDKEPYGADKGNTKANMAFIRSERNAFGRLSPDALPPDIDIIDEAYAEVPHIGEDAYIEVEGKLVHKGTGEILPPIPELGSEPPPSESVTLESEQHWCEEHNCAFEKKVRGSSTWYAHKLPDGSWCNEAKKKEAAEPESGTRVEESQQPKRDPDSLKTINELYKACNEDFKLQPAQVISELGISSQSDISDTPAECYRKIAAVR